MEQDPRPRRNLVIERIRQFFLNPTPAAVDERTQEHLLRLATATLLVEMSRVDQRVDTIEQQAILANIRRHFDLTDDEARELTDLAMDKAVEARSLYEFTRVLNGSLSAAQKIQVVELMWQVAYADGDIDKYEDHLVRKVADLIYVPHHEFVAAKLRAAETAAS